MQVKLLLPGTLCLGPALAALLGCQREPVLTPTTLAAEAVSASSTISTFVRPGVVNSQASLALVAQQANGGDATRRAGYDKVIDFLNGNALPTSFPAVNGWRKYEESLGGSTQRKSCQAASDNAIFPAVETAYNYYDGSTLQKLRDREDPCGLIAPDNTFLGFTSFTHRGIGQVR